MEGLTLQQKIWKILWSVVASMKTLLIYLVLPALFMSIGMLFQDRSAAEVVDQSSNFYYTVGIVVTLIVLHRLSRKRGSSLFQEATLEYRGLNRRRILLLLTAGFGCSFLFSALITVIPFPEFLMESYQKSSDGLRDGTDQTLALLSTILLAPFAEEIVFRGYMLNRLLQDLDERTAVLASAAVFALCHVSLLWMVYAALMGYLLAEVAVREDNVAYSIALHIGFNLSVLPIWLIRQNETLYETVFGGPIRIAVYGILAAAAAWWALREYREEEITC